MYIRNVDETKISVFQCGKRVANYLIVNGAMVLGEKNGTFFFSDTEELKELLAKAPWHLRVAINNGFKFI